MLFKELLEVIPTIKCYTIRIDVYDVDTDTTIKNIYKMNEIPHIYDNSKVCIIHSSDVIFDSDPYQYFVTVYK